MSWPPFPGLPKHPPGHMPPDPARLLHLIFSDGLSVFVQWLDPEGALHVATLHRRHIRGQACGAAEILLRGGFEGVPRYGTKARKDWAAMLRKWTEQPKVVRALLVPAQ